MAVVYSAGSRGSGGDPRDFDGSVALAENLLFVVAVRAARHVTLSLALSG